MADPIDTSQDNPTPVQVLETTAKPRKRFVGKGRTSANALGGAEGSIEDGVMTVRKWLLSSQMYLMHTQLILLYLGDGPRVSSGRLANQVPDDILNDPILKSAMTLVRCLVLSCRPILWLRMALAYL
jgi:hypothetical protein